MSDGKSPRNVWNNLLVWSAKVSSVIKDAELVNIDDKSRRIAIAKGTTVIFVELIENNEGIVFVRILSPIVSEMKKLDGKILLKIFEKNSQLIFGKITLDLENRRINLENNLLGNFIDEAEFVFAIAELINFADAVDEELASLTEGKRVIDMLR